MTKPRCEACKEQEHDACLNLLWDAGCPCRHDRWPEARCGVLGRDLPPNTRVYVCELRRGDHPRHPRNGLLIHEGHHWTDPNPHEKTAQWWGWSDKPRRWTWKAAIAPPGRFDPWDPTVPHLFEQMEGVA